MRIRPSIAVLAVVAAMPGAASRTLAQTPVADEFRVNTYVGGVQSFPRGAAAANGDFTFIWNSRHEGSLGQDGDYDGVFGQRFLAEGVPIGPEFQVNTAWEGQQIEARLAMTPAGQSVILWWTHIPGVGPLGLFGQRFDEIGNPRGGEFPAGGAPGRRVLRPDVAAHPDGSFIVVWEEWDDSPPVKIFGQRFRADGAPLGEFIVMETEDDVWAPKIAALPNGGFVVAWTHAGDIRAQLFSPSGSTLGGPFPVSEPSSQYRYGTELATSLDGFWVAVWASQWNTPGAVIQARLFEADGTALGPEFVVSRSRSERWVDSPTVAMSKAGDFVVAWETYDGKKPPPWPPLENSHRVYARQFAADGAPVGPERKVNQGTFERRFRPDPIVQSRGRFFVAWGDLGPSTGPAGVMARGFNPPRPRISCPSRSSFVNAPGRCSGAVDFRADVVGIAYETSCTARGSVVVSPADFPVGRTRVRCAARNDSGENACSFVAIVTDVDSPSILCPAEQIAQGTDPEGARVTYPKPNITDNCSARVSCNHPSGSVFPLGTTDVTCTAEDWWRNSSTCTFPVTVLP